MPPRRAASGRAAASASRRVSYKEEDDDEDNVGGSTSESEGGSPSEFEASGQSGQEEDDDDEEDLDTATSEEEEQPTPKRKGRQRGRQSASSATSAKRRGAGSAKSTPVKRQKVKDDGDGEEGGEQPEFVGGEVMSVTKLVPPPREKHEPGKLGRPVIDFLAHLADPKYNDREWFHTNERVWKWVKEGESKIRMNGCFHVTQCLTFFALCTLGLQTGSSSLEVSSNRSWTRPTIPSHGCQSKNSYTAFTGTSAFRTTRRPLERRSWLLIRVGVERGPLLDITSA